MQKIHTNNAPAAVGPYSQAIVSGGPVFTSGQIAIDPATNTVESADIAGQTEQVELCVDRQDLTYWDTTAHAFIPERGTATFYIGASSADIRTQVDIPL